MKSKISLFMAATLIVGALAPAGSATAARSRRVSVRYLGAGAGLALPGYDTPSFCPIDLFNPGNVCIAVPLSPKDRFVQVSFKDVTGQKVSAYLMEATDTGFVGYDEFCGAMKRPVRLSGHGSMLQIFYSEGVCDDGAPSVATTGEIVFTFTSTR
ncbi:MAG: hypothetical protein M3238_06980 [Actinomycetota bacterium]|nr:hypothetical protein [Actinomycetota bacterium]